MALRSAEFGRFQVFLDSTENAHCFGYILKDPTGVAALCLGKRGGKELVYMGKVGTGWLRTVSSQICKQLETVVISKSKLTKPIKKPKATWVEPTFVADVEYRDITSDGLLSMQFEPSEFNRASEPGRFPVCLYRRTESGRLDSRYRSDHPAPARRARDPSDVAALSGSAKGMSVVSFMPPLPFSLSAPCVSGAPGRWRNACREIGQYESKVLVNRNDTSAEINNRAGVVGSLPNGGNCSAQDANWTTFLLGQMQETFCR